MSNLELFDNYTNKLLKTLSEGFPLFYEVTLQGLTGIKELCDPPESDSHFTYFKREVSIARDTVYWLKSAGYLEYKKFNYDVFEGVHLTEKGLAVTGLKPDSLAGTK